MKLDLDELERALGAQEMFRRVLRASAEIPLKVYPEPTDFSAKLPRLPRWPSGLVDIDRELGGFTAVTALGGPPGTGKSQWALSCALENAKEGTLVAYLDAENFGGEQQERIEHWYQGEIRMREDLGRLALNFAHFAIDDRHSWQTMMLKIADLLLEHPRVLIVLDSIQSLADEIDPARGMLATTAALYSIMNRIVRATAGRIAFLVLTELNREGTVKGGAGQYRGTMVFTIGRAALPEDTDLQSKPYRISCVKNRTGPTPGDMGLFDLDWWCCRFRRTGA